MSREQLLIRRIRIWLLVFVVGLIVSGLTAIPLNMELQALSGMVGATGEPSAYSAGGFHWWIATVRAGVHQTYTVYPWMAYGTDWLAFAHLVIAVAFIGPWRDPVRNAWVVEFGIIACLLVVPAAFVFGAVRGIPVFWRIVDCSFGMVGIIPLGLCRQWIRELAAVKESVPGRTTE
ncbi:MAG: hypothetical protein V1809_07630 [Planctomycetota bacterium]